MCFPKMEPLAELIGYQAHFKELNTGLFFFNHSCGITFSIKVGLFQDLYDGPIYKEKITGFEECSGCCLCEDDLRLCPVKCECAYVREIIQIINTYTKTNN